MSDTEKLDAFFARAADVLADWQPSDDAMVARMSDKRAFDLYNNLGYGEFWLPKKPVEPPARAPLAIARELMVAVATVSARNFRRLAAGKLR